MSNFVEKFRLNIWFNSGQFGVLGLLLDEPILDVRSGMGLGPSVWISDLGSILLGLNTTSLPCHQVVALVKILKGIGKKLGRTSDCW